MSKKLLAKQNYRKIIAVKKKLNLIVLSCGHERDKQETDRIGKTVKCIKCFCLREIQGF